MTIKKINTFFDKLEDRTRAKLSHSPILYALLGGIGVILFWRGVWHIADDLEVSSLLSIVIGTIILLATGVFVSAFIGNRLILSGLRGEKKMTEKTKDEIELEASQLERIGKKVDKIENEIAEIESEIEHNHHK